MQMDTAGAGIGIAEPPGLAGRTGPAGGRPGGGWWGTSTLAAPRGTTGRGPAGTPRGTVGPLGVRTIRPSVECRRTDTERFRHVRAKESFGNGAGGSRPDVTQRLPRQIGQGRRTVRTSTTYGDRHGCNEDTAQAVGGER